MALLEFDFLGNTLLAWSLALAAFLATFTILPLLKGYVTARARKRTEAGHDAPPIVDIIVLLISRTSRLFLWVIAVYAGSRFLELPARADKVLSFLVIVISWLQVGIWLVSAARYGLEERQRRRNSPVTSGMMTIIMFVAHLVVWAMVVLLALSNLGINITALVAGLGIGGVAIALAVQTVLGDLLASLSIALDKPFNVGDFIVAGNELGTVERIGIKSTRVRSLSGEQIIFPNSDLLSSRVRNMGRMFERRVVFKLGVTYETPRDKLRQLPDILKAAVQARDKTRFDRAHFMNFGDFALELEVVYYVLAPDYNVYMDIQQAIYLQVHEAFEKLGVEFAYPTRKLFLAGSVETLMAGAEDSDGERPHGSKPTQSAGEDPGARDRR